MKEDRIVPKIRLAKEEDAEEVSKLICETLKKINSKDYTPEQINILKTRNSPDKIKDKIKEKNFYCITFNDEITGTICLQDDKIKKLYMSVSYLGKGFGQKLLSYIESIAKMHGLKKLTLNSTLTAVSFYKKNKYKKISEKKFEMNGIVITFIEMEKKLED